MTLGIYVDRWRLGTHSEKEVDNLLEFCDIVGVTDMYLHCHEDIAVQDNWDYRGYVLKKAKQRIHFWVSLTLGREHSFTRTKAGDVKIAKATKEQGEVLTLDLSDLKSKTSYLARIENLITSHPEVFGIHLDKLKPVDALVISEIRNLYRDKYISLAEYGYSFPVNLRVDEIIKMRTSGYSDISEETFEGFESVAISLFACNLTKTTERIQYLKSLGKNPILYSYGAFSSEPKETREDLVRAINDANK